ncbi:MAG: amino acid ABC transporter permease [Bacillota bacterium]|jgi:polar amino acid transport system permease protein|nr:amino acid ABC transporter permease [Bacillota bacterium]HHU29768.1 amino acid ABC transporter permease [Bacillota bacterium]
MQFQFEKVFQYWPMILRGVQMTIQLTVVAVAIGTVIGLVTSLLRLSRFKPVSLLARCYVDFIRGTPLMVQILLFYYGLPQLLGIKAFDRYFSGVVTLSINSGAYVAEIFRAGIQSIHHGQMEAARSLGMTYFQAMRYVILPQAFKRCIPPLGNEFIAMLKDSSLVSIISLQELMMTGRIIEGHYYRPFETYIVVALLYLFMTTTISQLVSYLERVFGKGDHSKESA